MLSRLDTLKVGESVVGTNREEVEWTGVIPDKILRGFQKKLNEMEVKPILYTKAEFA